MQDVKYSASFRESPKTVDSMTTFTATLEFHLRSSPLLSGTWRILDCESCKHRLIKTIEDEGIFLLESEGILKVHRSSFEKQRGPKIRKILGPP